MKNEKKNILIEIKNSISLKLFFKQKKLKSLKEFGIVVGIALGALTIALPSCHYLFNSPNNFFDFLKDVLAVGLSFVAFAGFFVIGMGIFSFLPDEFGEKKYYLDPKDHCYKNDEVLKESINHYDSWLSLFLSLHLIDEKQIEFSNIKEVEAAMKFNQEILTQLDINSLTDDIKKEVEYEQKKIYNLLRDSLKYIESNNLMKDKEFLNILDRTTTHEKLIKIKQRQENYLKTHELAINLREIAHQKRQAILEQKEEVIIVENEIKEVKEKLKALAL
jgi:hypothetical protein